MLLDDTGIFERKKYWNTGRLLAPFIIYFNKSSIIDIEAVNLLLNDFSVCKRTRPKYKEKMALFTRQKGLYEPKT